MPSEGKAAVPVRPIRSHGRWELLAAVGQRPDFEEDEQRLPEEDPEGGQEGDDVDAGKASSSSDEKVKYKEENGGGRGTVYFIACVLFSYAQ